jgi:hypothetical protein
MIVLEVVATIPILYGAAFMIGSVHGFLLRDRGFDAAHLDTLQVILPVRRYKEPTQRLDAIAHLQSELSAVQGVIGVDAVSRAPFRGDAWAEDVALVDSDSQRHVQSAVSFVSDGFLRTLRVRTLQGTVDGLSVPASWLTQSPSGSFPAVVNERLRQELLDTGSAVGRRVLVADKQAVIIGVIANVQLAPGRLSPLPEVYVPIEVRPPLALTLVAREAPQASIDAAVLQQRVAYPGDVQITSARSAQEIILDAAATETLARDVLTAFACAILLIALLGTCWHLVAEMFGSRRRLAISWALGATTWQLARAASQPAVTLLCGGAFVGALVSLVARSALQALVEWPARPSVGLLGGVVGLALLVLTLAVAVPCRLLVASDPSAELRES